MVEKEKNKNITEDEKDRLVHKFLEATLDLAQKIQRDKKTILESLEKREYDPDREIV